MNRKWLVSPVYSLLMGYFYITMSGIIFYANDFYRNSQFFSWGVPIQFMGVEINDQETYYLLLLFVFFHQLINNWINETTYPWIINYVQDKKENYLGYSKLSSMVIVNLFSLYSELDVVIILSGLMSQITFFLMIIIANAISTTLVNWQNIKNKNKHLLV